MSLRPTPSQEKEAVSPGSLATSVVHSHSVVGYQLKN